MSSRHVYLGHEGGTPRKVFTFERDSAPDEIEAATPVDVRSAKITGSILSTMNKNNKAKTNPFALNKSVNLGIQGETPRKMHIFQRDGAPDEIEPATPEVLRFEKKTGSILTRPQSLWSTDSIYYSAPSPNPMDSRTSNTPPVPPPRWPSSYGGGYGSFDSQDHPPIPPPTTQRSYPHEYTSTYSANPSSSASYSPTSSSASSPSSRPKTSRGNANPTPDEFADYVIQSPPSLKNGKGDANDRFVYSFHNDESEEEISVGYPDESSNRALHAHGGFGDRFRSDNSAFLADRGSNGSTGSASVATSGSTSDDNVIALGYWLFGALAVV